VKYTIHSESVLGQPYTASSFLVCGNASAKPHIRNASLRPPSDRLISSP
jgi:hypothetical protein